MRIVMLVIAMLAVVPGLGQGISVVDQAGRTVAIPAPPARVASVFGVATAYVYALGAGDLLVGARYLGLPDSPLARQVMARIDPAWEAKTFPAEVTVETLVALRAELVLAGTRHLPLAGLLGEVGIPTAVYAPETFAAVREATLFTGAVLGREAGAKALVSLYDEILAEVARNAPPDGRPRVLFVGTAPLRVASGSMYQAALIELAGGVAVTRDLAGSWQNVSPEQVLLWDPEVIIIAPYGPVQPSDFLTDPVYQGVAAVRRGEVYKMPQLLFAWDTPIPESVLGALWLAELLYPGKVPLVLSEVASRFYRDFYGVELGAAERAVVGEVGVVDQAGREVVLPRAARRVVSLQGGTSWIVYALGGAKSLVGAYYVSLPTEPLAQAALAELDPAYRAKEFPIKPTLEAILALRPDVVFASSVVHGEAFAQLLAEVGIPTVLYYPETLDEVEGAILLTGEVLGRQARAKELARWFREIIARVTTAAEGIEPRPRVYFAAYSALNVYAGDVIQNVITELAGGEPLGKAVGPRPGLFWQRVGIEQVIVWDPEVVLVPSYSRARREDFLADPAWATVAAVREGRVFRFPGFFAPWDVPGPEVALGLLWLAETLHPGATGLDLVSEVVRFYEEFYGSEIRPDEMAAFLGK